MLPEIKDEDIKLVFSTIFLLCPLVGNNLSRFSNFSTSFSKTCISVLSTFSVNASLPILFETNIKSSYKEMPLIIKLSYLLISFLESFFIN